MAKENPEKLILDSENRYHGEIENIAHTVAQKEYKIILLAGPSGSGKTTSAHILRDKLSQRGVESQVVSLDNFYLPADKVPKLENGEPDFETIYSLDLPEINRCFYEIISKDKTSIPIFDFNIKRRAENRLELNISEHGVVIVEGLHALNPILTEKLPLDKLFKIYISVNENVFDDEGNILLSSRKMRLIRRISRDFLYRNTSVERTLKFWTAVVKGEEKYLYAFKDTADKRLKTFHPFEPLVFRNIILSLLKNLSENAENYDYIMSARRALLQFESLPTETVPEDSLIREFIVGGKYENCK